jgi:hypothetical protein
MMMFISANYCFAQEIDSNTTDQFLITGKVKLEKNFTLNDIKRFPIITLTDVNVSCSPKTENRVKEIKAVMLKNLLDSVSFQYEKSRMLNQYYFLFIAKDGYKMVFSFNEIYNTEIGKNLYIVTEIEGNPINEMGNSIMVLTTKDIKGGSRNMKWLSKIIVGMAE